MFKQAGTSSQELNPSAGYQSHLIDTLTEEHKLLLDGLDKARQFLARSKIIDFDREIKVFKGRFQSHVMAENLKLYLYLRLSLQSDADKKKFADTMRKEMKPISERVNTFFDNFGNGRLTSVAIYACETELSGLRRQIHERFSEEERKLFPLYKKY